MTMVRCLAKPVVWPSRSLCVGVQPHLANGLSALPTHSPNPVTAGGPCMDGPEPGSFEACLGRLDQHELEEDAIEILRKI